MESRKQVAQYAASMATELRKLCRDANLNDLAYLFEVAASEAAQVRSASNGSAHHQHAVALSASHG